MELEESLLLFVVFSFLEQISCDKQMEKPYVFPDLTFLHFHADWEVHFLRDRFEYNALPSIWACDRVACVGLTKPIKTLVWWTRHGALTHLLKELCFEMRPKTPPMKLVFEVSEFVES